MSDLLWWLGFIVLLITSGGIAAIFGNDKRK